MPRAVGSCTSSCSPACARRTGGSSTARRTGGRRPVGLLASGTTGSGPSESAPRATGGRAAQACCRASAGR
eukprot:4383216-Alexandrium_andersonii.AAC.1